MRNKPISKEIPQRWRLGGPVSEVFGDCRSVPHFTGAHNGPLFQRKVQRFLKIPLPEKGTITKEVPKQPEQSAPEGLSELTKPAEPVRPAETRSHGAATEPEGTKTSQVMPAPKPPAPSSAASQRLSISEAPPESKSPPAPSAESQEPAPKDLFPKKGAPSATPASAALKAPAKPQAKAAGTATPAKPAPSTKSGDYAVQVGSIFKDKPQAETVRSEPCGQGLQRGGSRLCRWLRLFGDYRPKPELAMPIPSRNR